MLYKCQAHSQKIKRNNALNFIIVLDAPVDFSRTSNGSISNDCKLNLYNSFDSPPEKFGNNEAGVAKFFGPKEADLKAIEKCKFRVSPGEDILQKIKSTDVVASKYYYGPLLDVENDKEKGRNLLFESGMKGCSDSDSEDEIDIVGTQC